jgi:hypothetical protein
MFDATFGLSRLIAGKASAGSTLVKAVIAEMNTTANFFIAYHLFSYQ